MVDIREDDTFYQKKPSSSPKEKRKHLSIYWKCCHTYSHIPKDSKNQVYQGRCPKCGAKIVVPVGEQGTTKRMFIAE